MEIGTQTLAQQRYSDFGTRFRALSPWSEDYLWNGLVLTMPALAEDYYRPTIGWCNNPHTPPQNETPYELMVDLVAADTAAPRGIVEFLRDSLVIQQEPENHSAKTCCLVGAFIETLNALAGYDPHAAPNLSDDNDDGGVLVPA